MAPNEGCCANGSCPAADPCALSFGEALTLQCIRIAGHPRTGAIGDESVAPENRMDVVALVREGDALPAPTRTSSQYGSVALPHRAPAPATREGHALCALRKQTATRSHIQQRDPTLHVFAQCSLVVLHRTNTHVFVFIRLHNTNKIKFSHRVEPRPIS